MYFIRKDGENLGNPMCQPFNGCVALQDELLGAYLACKGFCAVTVDDNSTVTAVTVNQDALDAYDAEHPETEPEPTEADDSAAMLVDHEYRLTLLELGLNE